MEDSTSKHSAPTLEDHLKLDLAQATSDRSLLDCSFLTAYDDNDPQQQQQYSIHGETTSKIKSQGLVDSNNEESSDGEGYAANSMSAKFTIGSDSSLPSANSSRERSDKNAGEKDDVDSVSCASLVINSEQTRDVGLKRSSWRERSLNNRSWRQTNDDDDDDDGGGVVADASTEPVNSFEVGETKDCPIVACRSMINNNNNNVTTNLLEKQAPPCESILIKVEQYHSIDQVAGEQSVELMLARSDQLLASDDPDEQHQSIEQHNRALDQLVHLNVATTIDSHHHQQILFPPAAPPPTRTTSSIDLSSYVHHQHQQQPLEGQHSALPYRPHSMTTVMEAAAGVAGGATVAGVDICDRQQKTGNNLQLINSTTEKLLFTRRSASGFHSDYSNQIQSVTRIIDNNSRLLERRQIETRLRLWKKSNKIITHITENPFNLHLDYLDKLNQLDVHNKQEKEIKQQQQRQRQQSTNSNNTTEPINDKQQHKQEELQNCASHLSYLYKKDPAVMDNSNDFRALLYNIICCLLVQDDQVLSTPSVGKMLEVIRAHLESASRVYSTAAAAAASVAVVPSTTTTTTTGSHLAVDQTISQQQQQPEIAVCSEGGITLKPSADHKSDDPSTKRPGSSLAADNSRLSPEFSTNADIGHGKRGKPVDFRRISSVSYNDEHLINDLCERSSNEATNNDETIMQTSSTLPGRSGSLCVGRSSPGGARARVGARGSLWAYQELSAEPRHLLSCSGGGLTPVTGRDFASQSSLDGVQTRNNSTSSSSGGGGVANAMVRQDSNSSSSHDPTNDSGNGTLDFQILSDLTTATRSSASSACSSAATATNPRSRCSVFRPKQQPSYMSTDEYLSAYRTSATPGEDQDEDGYSSSPLAAAGAAGDCESDSVVSVRGSTVDVASRRAELEWTLNRLVNIELKHTWLTSNDTLRRAIRKIGVPNEIRGKVWLILIEQMIGSKYDARRLLQEARKTIQEADSSDSDDENSMTTTTTTIDEETQSILKQIELDVNRTMPGHKLFDDGAEGGVKLRQILVAYSVHVNRAIAYCQGFNFIVALLLSVFEGDEEKALRGFICIVDHIFPSKYYFDHYLTGARADQFLLADFICDQLIKNPTMAERKMVEGVTSSITLNWFISLFHGAVPTFTRLTILDHFMLEGVKALFRFTMAILYLAFQVTPPSSCEVFTTIRNTAKEMYDIKLLLSIVDQIKLPKDSYFAIRRSFYMVQSSFNSDQFYMQTLSNDAKKNMVSNRPLNVQQLPDTKPPALSFISSSTSPFIGYSSRPGGGDQTSNHQYQNFTIKNSISTDSMQGPRVRTSSDRTKVCIQSIGKLGRSHLKIIDVNVKSNERALMSPMRNCLVLGVSNNGKDLIIARQSSRRNYKTFREQDLNFHIHELCTEIFDGFYLEEAQLALILTHMGEVFKIDTSKCFVDHQEGSTETLMLRDSHSIAEHEKIKLRQVSMDNLTNLLWIYIECEDTQAKANTRPQQQQQQQFMNNKLAGDSSEQSLLQNKSFKNNNPFLCDTLSDGDEQQRHHQQQQQDPNNPNYQSSPAIIRSASNFQRRILMIDIVTFDLFSAFSIDPSFGEITNLRTSLVAFCQLANPMSSQFSSRIVQIGPTGHYEQLLSFSDVVDYMVNVPDSFKTKFDQQNRKMVENNSVNEKKLPSQRYSSLRRLLNHSKSLDTNHHEERESQVVAGRSIPQDNINGGGSSGTLTRYYRSLMRSHTTVHDLDPTSINTSSSSGQQEVIAKEGCIKTIPVQASRTIQDNTLRSIISLGLGDFSGLCETNYIPVNMAFIFRNGKIALFEFTETYAIHTRESQLDRYDYSRVIDVTKKGDAFIVTILTVFDKLIKVVI